MLCCMYHVLCSGNDLNSEHRTSNIQYLMMNVDGLVKSLAIVIPAKARIQSFHTVLDSRHRGNDGHGCLMAFYDFINGERSISN
jgi:hypothetical protein